MSVLDNLFQRDTAEQMQQAGADVSIVYATALGDSDGGYVLVQLGPAIGADEAMGADGDGDTDWVDMDDVGDDDTVADIDEDMDSEELTEEEIEEGMVDVEDIDETDADDESDEDSSGEVVDTMEDAE